MRLLLMAALLAPACFLTAQNRERAPDYRAPEFHVGMGFAGGEFDHETSGSNLDDDTEAALFRFRFEGISSGGVGGGVRLEYMGSDDDLFRDAGFLASEAKMFTSYLHFTYEVEARRFRMPFRAGLMFNYYQLKEVVTDNDIVYSTVGPYFEIAPEITLAGRRQVRWSIYSELGVGGGFTGIDIDGDENDYYSFSVLWGVELGTRLKLGPFEMGIAYLGRWQWMDESEPENNSVVFGYDAAFNGFMFNVGARF